MAAPQQEKSNVLLKVFPSRMANMAAGSDDDFEPERGRRCALQDVSAVIPVIQAAAPREPQVFYFSQKMFDFMCENGNAERVHQEALRLGTQRKGDILKRKEAAVRTANMRKFLQEKGFEKPPGSEIAAARRKRHHTKRNTDQVMGRSADQQKRRRYHAGEQTLHSDASQQQPEELSQLSQQPSASECVSSQKHQPKRKNRTMWGKFDVPLLNTDPLLNSDETSQCDDAEKKDERSAVAALAIA